MTDQRPAWDEKNLDAPHQVTDKAQRVQAMFGEIAPSYDLNNRVHSLWRDQAWRRAAVRAAQVQPGDVVLDVACGTGDLTMAFAKSPARSVLGIDFTYQMLQVANAKRDADTSKISGYFTGDAMRLPMADASVDVLSIAFGIRNVADPARAAAEFARVLRPGGRVIVLEFSLPRNPVFLWAYNVYFRHIMPRTATLISGDKSGAYRYLPKSVNTFIGREEMVGILSQAGFVEITVKPMTMGIAVIYRGVQH